MEGERNFESRDMRKGFMKGVIFGLGFTEWVRFQQAEMGSGRAFQVKKIA